MKNHEPGINIDLFFSMLEDAARLAAEQRDEYGLDCVLKRCGPQNRGLSERILEMKVQLAASGKKK